MKLNHHHAAALTELMSGARMASDWINGSGHFISKRSIPPHAERIERRQLATRKLPKRITKVFDAHPRCAAVIAITDMRVAKRALSDAQKSSHGASRLNQ